MEMNINKPSDDRYYSTTNLYLASYLFAKGAELVNVNRDNPNQTDLSIQQLLDFEKK
jgi:hypothetical protein